MDAARAIDFIPHDPSVDHLFTVGRLDENSDGLLIVNERWRAHQPDDSSEVSGVGERIECWLPAIPNYSDIKQLQDGLFSFAKVASKSHHVKKLKKQGKSTNARASAQ